MAKTTPLEDIIRKQVASYGPMPVSRYMELCLTHPQHGYYINRDPLGRDGDFITAPEVSQMFGELIGLWAASVWTAMGSPSEVKFVELGPGRGTMMADALRAIRILPKFFAAVSVHLVEASPALQARQVVTLANTKTIEWYDSINKVPAGPAIVLANEFFDVLPIHQAVRTATGWHERVVDVDGDDLVFGVAKDPIPAFEVLLPPLVRASPPGAIFEWRPDSAMMDIARRLTEQDGAALIIDYGHTRSDAGDTFQAVAKHAFANPLKNPGQFDVTAHVDFDALMRAANTIGARVHGPVDQATFLNRLGIDQRAATLMKNAPPEEEATISAALKRLTGTGQKSMGSLFKVLGISHPSIATLTALEPIVPAAATGKASAS